LKGIQEGNCIMCSLLQHAEVAELLPPRHPEDHKGAFGHVFILAGSRGLSGAAKLTALAAARSGAGLVTLGVPHPIGDVVAASLLEIMTQLFPSTDNETIALDAMGRALRIAAAKNAVVLGPGLGSHPNTTSFVQEFTIRCSAPLVIDADGLNALAPEPNVLSEREAPLVITPHPGEMARLTNSSVGEVQAHREEVARSFAKTYRCVVVLKGHQTVIAAPDGRTALNPTGNHGMATGGSGDVLAGLLGGFIAQGCAPFEAACLAVYLHGLAGDAAAETMTPRAMIAGDLLNALPEAFRRLENG